MKTSTIAWLTMAVAVCTLLLSATYDNNSTTNLKIWKAGQIVSQQAVKTFGEDKCFAAETITDKVFQRMRGKSFPDGCKVKREELRYVKVLHVDTKGNIKIGELVCNKAIAADVVKIFRELYRNKYPIEKMVLIDNYNADDELSMRDNNTSCFCYRVVAGSNKLSAHSRGLAIDINPLYNPYYKYNKNGKRTVRPSNASAFCDRTGEFDYKIEKGDLCYKLFVAKGFTWGGSWRSCKDFQHFERNI